ncbi:hypothetical protein LI82_11030 [Methanococcoides methylutens]|uniref:4Fe-4S domain-containing protein n=1 Tax=Methanococcoides methylutens TaxID=2226 RepID=A0A099SZC9_METMT|nr:(Fe-S)-binding protein [Methanococcoides methylutens]KGK98242.1 hypothetical protein LI82_11030 [Methanococcoides methylutens]
MEGILELLPGYNCGKCGYKQCRDLAENMRKAEDIGLCPFMGKQQFSEKRKKLKELLKDRSDNTNIIGIIDGLEADFTLAPLAGEPSCREDIHPIDGTELETGDLVRYRPLGCPITHFAKVIEASRGMNTIHMVGPLQRLGNEDVQFIDAGICLIFAFDGKVEKGRIPRVGETVKFIPTHCMMQKVHSGIVVGVEERNVRIEAIDLKVW